MCHKPWHAHCGVNFVQESKNNNECICVTKAVCSWIHCSVSVCSSAVAFSWTEMLLDIALARRKRSEYKNRHLSGQKEGWMTVRCYAPWEPIQLTWEWNILSGVSGSVTNNNGFWIGWLGLLTLIHIHSSELEAIVALSLFHTLSQFTVTHALGFSVFSSRILATDLYQSHCNFKITYEAFLAV
jgi:hypothetical protein